MKPKNAFLRFSMSCALLSAFLCLFSYGIKVREATYPSQNSDRTNPVALFEGEADDDLSGVMVPIPMKDRVFNRTGIQCVWASLECIGRYAEEMKLIGLTKDRDCQSYSSPTGASRKLNQINVKFEQTTSKNDKSLIYKAVVKEKRGVLFGIPGHAMVMVHYDEKNGVMKYVNNSDADLKIRTWKIEDFDRRWDGWVCAIYADNDIIRLKFLASKITVADKNDLEFIAPKGYILFPQ